MYKLNATYLLVPNTNLPKKYNNLLLTTIEQITFMFT